jgi:hypothetical protein
MIVLERRTATAMILRLWANGLLQGADDFPLLLLGVLNVVFTAQTSLILNGRLSSQIGTKGFHRSDGRATRFFNLDPRDRGGTALRA